MITNQSLFGFLVKVIAVIGFVVLLSCGGGSSDGDNNGGNGGNGTDDNIATNNLSTTSIEVIDAPQGESGFPQLQVGHPMRVSLGIFAAEDTQNVPVDIYLLDKEQYDAGVDDLRQFIIGSAVFPFVEAGDHRYVAEVVVPYSELVEGNDGELVEVPIDPVGTFYLEAEVDAPDLVEEFDEDDNRPGESNFAETTQIVEIDDSYRAVPNIVLEKLTLDIPTIALPEEEPDSLCEGEEKPNPFEPDGEVIANIKNAQLGVTAVVSATGSYWLNGLPAPIPRVEFAASVHIPGMVLPVLIWDSLQGDFADTISVPALKPGVRETVHLDLRIPPATVQAIKDYVVQTNDWSTIARSCLISCGNDQECYLTCIGNSIDIDDFNPAAFDLEISVAAYDEQDNLIDEYDPPGFTASNELEVEINVLPPSPPPPEQGPLRFETSYRKSLSGSNFGAGVELLAWGAIDQAGASAGAETAIPVTLFGYGFDFLGLETLANGNPAEPFDSSFSLDLSFAGITIFSKVIDASLCDGWDPLQCQEYLKWEPDLWEVEKSKSTEKNFMISVVPVTAKAEAGGTVGFYMAAQICVGEDMCEDPNTSLVPEFQAYTGPKAAVEADVSAGVGHSKFSAGVGGDITLISDTFYATANASVAYDVGKNEIEGTLTEDVTNTLTGPNGGVYVYVAYPCVKICRKYGVPYPCGTKTCTQKKYLDKWQTFEVKDVLFCDEQAALVSLD